VNQKIPPFFYASAVAIFLLVYSCATVQVVPDEKIATDRFYRNYPVDFNTFHPKLNSSLQDYARGKKGNAFQVIRLGNDAVIIQGVYKKDGDQDRFSAVITVKPAGHKKSSVEIKISSTKKEISSDYFETAAKDLFRIVEKGTGLRPQE